MLTCQQSPPPITNGFTASKTGGQQPNQPPTVPQFLAKDGELLHSIRFSTFRVLCLASMVPEQFQVLAGMRIQFQFATERRAEARSNRAVIIEG